MKMLQNPIRIAACLFLVLAATPHARVCAQEDISPKLADYLPLHTNYVTMVRVSELLDTSVAKEQKWIENEDILGMGENVPVWANQVAIGAKIDRKGMFKFGAILMDRPAEITMHEIAAGEGSQVETLVKKSGVPTIYDTYYVDHGDSVLGVHWPLDRQLIADWIRQVAAEREVKSEYLREAIRNEGHIVFAVDLSTFKTSDDLANYAKVHEELAADAVSLEADLKNLVGITTRIMIGESPRLSVTIDFADDVSSSADSVKQLLVQVLTDSQSAIPEMQELNATKSGNRVTLKTDVSLESLYLLTSTLSFNSSEGVTTNAEDWIQNEPVDVLASRRYLRSIDQSIKKLERSSVSAKNALLLANAFEREATKLRERNSSGVAPEILQYAYSMHEYFRAIAASLDGQSLKIDTLNDAVTWNVSQTRGGWVWGSGLFRQAGKPNVHGAQSPGFELETNLAKIREKQAAVVLKGNEARVTLWEMIWEDQYNIKAEMRLKFGDDFIDAPKRRKR